ncbi:MAG: hypothetical protein AB8B85_21430 [Paracoccaceae bacterium]
MIRPCLRESAPPNENRPGVGTRAGIFKASEASSKPTENASETQDVLIVEHGLVRRPTNAERLRIARLAQAGVA